MSAITYKLNGTDFTTYGVRVSDSRGVIDGLRMKEPQLITSWPEYHGEVIDLAKIIYEPRDIDLECWIKATGRVDFFQKVNSFLNQFSQAGLKRLEIAIDPDKPLCYEVYLRDRMEIDKKWRETQMFGTFELKLREPEPVKRLLKWIRTGSGDATVSITVTSQRWLSFFWGDGTKTVGVNGTDQVVQHTYSTNGTYFIIIAGNIEEIEAFTTSAETIWSNY